MCNRCVYATQAVRETAAAISRGLRLPAWVLRTAAVLIATACAVALGLAAYLLALHTPG